MTGEDYELEKAVMCRAVGKAISGFVSKTDTRDFSLSAVCDEPDVTYDEGGKPHHGVNIRVYLTIHEEDDYDE